MTARIADELTPDAVSAGLTAERLGTTIDVHRSVPSTMDLLSEMARAGAPEGAVVLADHQSAGRGRHGRSWVAPAGTALLMSVLLRPDLVPDRIGEVQMAFALAVAGVLDSLIDAEIGLQPGSRHADRGGAASDTAEDSPAHTAAHAPETAPRTALKWPNDVVVGREKVAGLLSEAAWRGESASVVVGIGINVHQQRRQLPDGATSMAVLATGEPPASPPSRARLAADLLNSADEHYSRLLMGESLVESWSSRLETIGRRVVATSAGRPASGPTAPGDGAGPSERVTADAPEAAAVRIEGKAIGVTPTGALRVRTDGGEVVTVRAGDVTLAPREDH